MVMQLVQLPTVSGIDDSCGGGKSVFFSWSLNGRFLMLFDVIFVCLCQIPIAVGTQSIHFYEGNLLEESS